MHDLSEGPLRVPSHDGRLLAEISGDGGSAVQLLEGVTGSLLKTFHHHRGRVYALAWSPDDARLAMGSLDGLASVVATRGEEPVATFSGHCDWVIALAWSPSGDQLASGSFDRTVQVWVGVNGRALARPQDTSGSDGRRPPAGQPAPDLTRALIQGTRLPGQRLATYAGHGSPVYQVAFAPQSSRLASADFSGEVHVWEWDALTGAATQLCKLTPEGYVERVVWSPDGTFLALCPTSGLVELWDLTTGQFRAAFHSPNQVVWPERPLAALGAGGSQNEKR
jgi:WD40 repeat protein